MCTGSAPASSSLCAPGPPVGTVVAAELHTVVRLGSAVVANDVAVAARAFVVAVVSFALPFFPFPSALSVLPYKHNISLNLVFCFC